MRLIFKCKMHVVATAVWSLGRFSLIVVVLVVLYTVPPSDSADLVCPDTCKCDILEEKSYALCWNHSLNALPQYFDKQIQEIAVMFNSIEVIPDYVFHGLQQLSFLLMPYNKIRELREQAFDSLFSLQYIDLSHNNIVILPSRVIQNNEKVRFFYLNHNDLAMTGPFLISPSLELLDVSFCRITFLPHDAFIGIPNLTKLKINNNYITEFEAFAFRGLKKLETLSLGNNEVTDLNYALFHGVEDLRYLDLSNNTISKIPYKLFENNNKLKYLFLRNNSLIILPSGPIFASESLAHLDISFCNISFLPLDAFKSLPNLTTLRMVGNPLVSINVELMQPLKKLQVVLLGPESSCSNAFFRDIFEYLQKNSVVYYAPPLCSSNESVTDSNSVYSFPSTTTPYDEFIQKNIISDVLFRPTESPKFRPAEHPEFNSSPGVKSMYIANVNITCIIILTILCNMICRLDT